MSHAGVEGVWTGLDKVQWGDTDSPIRVLQECGQGLGSVQWGDSDSPMHLKECGQDWTRPGQCTVGRHWQSHTGAAGVWTGLEKAWAAYTDSPIHLKERGQDRTRPGQRTVGRQCQSHTFVGA